MFLQDSNSFETSLTRVKRILQVKFDQIQTFKNNNTYVKHFFYWSSPYCMCSCAWVLTWRCLFPFKLVSFVCQILSLWFLRRDYIKINTNSTLRQSYWLKVCCLKKFCTYHIRGDNFYDNCLITISYKQSFKDQVSCNILCEFLNDLLTLLLFWMNKYNMLFVMLKILTIKSY